MDELVGTTLSQGRYRIDRALRAGDQTATYLGMDLAKGNAIVVKVFHRSRLSSAKMRHYEREIQRRTQWRHPGAINYYASGVQGEFHYLVRPYVKGTDLGGVLSQSSGPLPMALVLHYARRIASALQYTHNRGAIHGRIKPENIIIDAHSGQAVVVDFDLSSLGGSDGSRDVSAAYMAPEQCLGMPLDHRTDIYALALLLYEALAGVHPLYDKGDDFDTIAQKQVNELPPSPSFLNPDLNPAIDAVLLRALAKSAEHRYPSVIGFVETLEEAAQQQIDTEAGRHRPRLLYWVIGLLAIGLVAFMLVVLPRIGENEGAEETPGGVALAVTPSLTSMLYPSHTPAGPPAGIVSYSPTCTRILPIASESPPTVTATATNVPATRSPTQTRASLPSPSHATATRMKTETLAPSSTATRTTVPTATRTASVGEITLSIQGLDEWGRSCTTLVLFKGEQFVQRVALGDAPNAQVSIARGSADWFRIEGDTSGNCPWSKWSLVEGDPNHIPIGADDVTVQFSAASAGPSNGGGPAKPTKRPGWQN